ncbi:MAG: hypothetical protein JW936_10035 [Sedimentisphaerales bacterium]|nr:hypothetical protein [Sedimentisphaerales bacterium]
MLGIDIYENEVRIVQLRRRGGSDVWLRAVTVPLDKQDVKVGTAVGIKLAKIIQDHGWSNQKAIMTVGSRSFFVKHFKDSALGGSGKDVGVLGKANAEAVIETVARSILVSPEDLVFDFRSDGHNSDDSVILLAGMEQSVVQHYVDLASSCGVKVGALELRCLAALNGLQDYWAESEERSGVLFVEGGYADLAIVEAGELAALYPISIETSGFGDADQSRQLLDELARLLNTMRLSSGQSPPSRIFLAAGDNLLTDQLNNDRERYEARLSVPVAVCGAPKGFALSEEMSDIDVGHYLPALGAALSGLHPELRWFDFLHSRGCQVDKKTKIVWQPALFLLVGLMILSAVFWVSLVQQRREELKDLERQIDETKPARAAIESARTNWELFRPFVAASGDGGALDGSRREYLRVLGEINQLFPDPNVAYVTNLTISDGMSSTVAGTASVGVSIRGRVSQGDVLPGFIDRLNDSWMFQEARQAGSLTRDDSDPLYPHTFSVTCGFRRQMGGTGE